MPSELTKLQDLINPQVMADMISADLPNLLRFVALAPLDYTLQGRPGNTVTVPAYKYIGPAEDLGEGVAIEYDKLQTESDNFSIKKIAKGVQLTDEAVLSGYGDPVGEAQKQIAMAIADKIDNDVLEALDGTTFTETAELGVDLFDKIEDKFNLENGETGVVFLNPKDYRAIRRNVTDLFTRASQLGDNILVKGVVGEVLGWQLVQSGKIVEGTAYAVLPGALKIYLKRGVNAESERDIDRKLTKFNADQHYGAHLYDEGKVIKVTVTDVVVGG